MKQEPLLVQAAYKPICMKPPRGYTLGGILSTHLSFETHLVRDDILRSYQ
jgi:hypothetical protein